MFRTGELNFRVRAAFSCFSRRASDGLVHMDEINSVFLRFQWVTSQINMKELLLNGQPVLEFSEIPHHSFVTCEILTQRRLFHFG